VADLAVVKGHDAVLAEPKTFMNASGEAVGRIAAFHKIEPTDVLVVVDEAQLAVGRLRLRRSGSAGGHNGLKSVIQRVGTDFPRLRIGVGRGDPRWDLADHVLSRFEDAERDTVKRAIERAADAVEEFIVSGIEAAMNAYNGDDPATTE
jgi:PTH1 family peptidyl-tRNA hydrolase